MIEIYAEISNQSRIKKGKRKTITAVFHIYETGRF